MTLAEIADRSRQEAAKWVDRVGWRPDGGLLNREGGAPTPAATLESFREGAPTRFFAGADSTEVAAILHERFAAACQDVIDAADAVCARRFNIFGYEGLSFGEPVDWHLDPIAGLRAPAVHWSRIDLGNGSIGDPKVIWELNRHQWLLALAQAYSLTGAEKYAQHAVDLIAEWSRANPYGIGVNWTSSLEVSYRAISWTWAFVLLRNASIFSAERFAGLRSLIGMHAAHVARYLSRYSSPNTHLTGEAIGLFYVGIVFPEFAESARWRDLGRQILIDECDRQVHSDGVHFEQSTCYQQYTVEIYLHFLILAERSDVAVPPAVRARVERMLEFLIAVNAPDGTTPQVGDADGGSLLPLTHRAASDCRGVLSTAAAFFGRADFAWASGGPTPELLWMLGVAGWNGFARLEASVPTVPSSTVFEEGGYVVMRNGWTRDAHQLLLDVGPLGCPLSGAHGHADLLSLQCTAFGEQYIVDPGTYCYNPEKDWRNYFRGTTAHSTVVVDWRDQAQPKGAFSWQSRPSARLTTWRSSDEYDYVDAWHDAYTCLADPVVHRRRVLFVKPRYWVVVDDIVGRAEHEIELRFQFGARQVHFGPRFSAAAHGKRGEGLWIVPFGSVELTGRIAEGRTHPIEGWLSTHYRERRPAPVVSYSATSRLPIRIATLLIPEKCLGQAPPRVERLFDAAGHLAGLSYSDADEIIRFDENVVMVESDGEIRGPHSASLTGMRGMNRYV